MRPHRVLAGLLFALVLAACQTPGVVTPPAGGPPAPETVTVPPETSTPVVPPGGGATPVPPPVAAGELPPESPPAAAATTPLACADGADCVVPAGTTALLDRSATFARLTVNGELVVADTDLTLTITNELLVDGPGALLQIGTRAQPSVNDITIVFDNTTKEDRTYTNMPGGGLNTMNGGRVKLYGSQGGQPFTRLAAPAPPGSTTLEVTEAHRCDAGQELLLGATGYNPDETERLTCAGSTGTTIQLQTPTQYQHDSADVGGVSIQAPVAMLSRNVQLISGPDAIASGARGHVMVMGGAAEMFQVRCDEMGASGVVGAYGCFHTHDKDPAAAADVVFGAVCTDSRMRCFVGHAGNGFQFHNTVTDNTEGYAYMIAEDRIETDWQLSNALAARTVGSPNAIEPDNEGLARGAGFWFGDTAGTVTRIEDAGTSGAAGIMVVADREPRGLAATKGYPARDLYDHGVWQDLVAHSTRDTGGAGCQAFTCGAGQWLIGSFANDGIAQYDAGGGTNYVAGIRHGVPLTQFFDVTSYHVEGMGLWTGQYTGVQRYRSAGAGEGVFGFNVRLDNPIFVGETGLAQHPQGVREALRNYDGYIDIVDGHCANFPGDDQGCIVNDGSLVAENRGFYGMQVIDGLTFDNVAHPVYLRDNGTTSQGRQSAVFVDVRGDITAAPMGYVTWADDPTNCPLIPGANAKDCSPQATAPGGGDDRVWVWSELGPLTPMPVQPLGPVDGEDYPDPPVPAQGVALAGRPADLYCRLAAVEV